MIEIEMSKDIREYEPKIMGPLTTRQVIFLGIGACYAIPVFKLLDKIPNLDFTLKIIIVVLSLAPMIICGWVKVFNMHAEEFARHVIVAYILTPTKRKYVSENSFDYIKKDAENPDAEPVKKKKKIYRKGENTPLK